MSGGAALCCQPISAALLQAGAAVLGVCECSNIGVVGFLQRAVLLAGVVANIYVGYDEGLYNLTVKAFRIFSTSYLIIGYNVYGSAFFTALNNGLISALISFLRTLLFQSVCIFLLPVIFGNGAIWLSITVAELLTLIVTITMIITQNKKYHYLK